MFRLFKNKSRDDLVQDRIENVFLALTNCNEVEFTELETIQILNCVRRRLSEELETKKSELFEQAVLSTQRGKEIESALKYLE